MITIALNTRIHQIPRRDIRMKYWSNFPKLIFVIVELFIRMFGLSNLFETKKEKLRGNVRNLLSIIYYAKSYWELWISMRRIYFVYRFSYDHDKSESVGRRIHKSRNVLLQRACNDWRQYTVSCYTSLFTWIAYPRGHAKTSLRSYYLLYFSIIHQKIPSRFLYTFILYRCLGKMPEKCD